MLLHLYMAAVGAALVLGLVLWMVRSGGVADRVLLALLPLLICLTAFTSAIKLGDDWNPSWDTSRLLPSYAFSRGINVYSTLEHGSIQTTMYPPGWVLSYLPVGVGLTPTDVVLAGAVLAQLYAFLPVLLIALAAARRWTVAVSATAAFVFASTRIGPLTSACFRAHSDAPAFGWGLLAAFLLWTAVRRERVRPWVLFSATAAAWMAVWSKQVMAPILPALVLWVLAVRGFRTCVRACGHFLASGLVLGAFMAVLFPMDGVFFNTVVIPSRCGWQGAVPWIFWEAAQELMSYSWGILVMMCLAGGMLYAGKGESTDDRPRKHGQAWGLALLLALFLVPTSLLGRAKVGGWPNCLSPTIYFLLAALCLLLVEVDRRLAGDEPVPGRGGRSWVLIGALLAVTSCWGLTALNMVRYTKELVPRRNAAQQAYRYLLRTGARDVFFPSLPLVHLMAQGELYHFSSSVCDREAVAGIPMSEEQRSRLRPDNVRMVCWQDSHWGNEYVGPTYFGSYTETVRLSGLQAFRCAVRPEDAVDAMETGGPDTAR